MILLKEVGYDPRTKIEDGLAKVVAKEKIIPRNIPQIESISYISCGEAYEKTSKFEKKFA
jgi:hypothetical protein